jgi:hypothetical protein
MTVTETNRLTAVVLSLMADLAMSAEMACACFDIGEREQNHDRVLRVGASSDNGDRRGRMLKLVGS